MLDTLQLKMGYREEANKKKARGTSGGRFGPPSPPINALVKILAIGTVKDLLSLSL